MLGPEQIPGAFEACRGTFKRDIILAYRSQGDIINPLVFALIVVNRLALTRQHIPERFRLAQYLFLVH